MGNRRCPQSREEWTSEWRRSACTLGGCSIGIADPRTKWYGRPAPTERDTTVGGALRVDEESAIVVESLTVSPSDVVPQFLGYGFGGDHQGVHREQGALMSLEGGRVALKCANDNLCTNIAAVSVNNTRSNLGCRRLFEDGDSATLYCLRLVRAPAGGMYRRTMRGVQATEDPVRVDAALRLSSIEQTDVILGLPP